MSNGLLVVLVDCHVNASAVDAFREASLANARESVKEPGVARFDVIQDRDDPTRFILIEVYRTGDAPAAHKQTTHYQRWRDTVAPMMVTARTSRKFRNLFPDDAGW